MHFSAPEWMIIIPVLCLAGWYWQQARLWRPLRVLCLLLAVLALMRLQIRTKSTGTDLWVLVDRSASIAQRMQQRITEWRALLQGASGRNDRLFWVDFADQVQMQTSGAEGSFSGRGNATRTALAVQYALGKSQPERQSRILLLTDGYSTEPLEQLTEPLLRESVPLDFRLLDHAKGDDCRAVGLDLPQQVELNQAFLLEAKVACTKDGKLPFRLLRSGKEVSSGKIEVKQGHGTVRLSDRIFKPGSYQYRLLVEAKHDAFPWNDRFENWIEVLGGSRVVVVSAYLNDPLYKTLTENGLQVELITDLSGLDAGRLSGASAVVLNNVPAHKIPDSFQQAIEFYVREQGGGFLMLGGEHSFASGGYFQSAVDDLLPVSMELRAEHRRFRGAMAIILDRSGSMGSRVSSGLTKMDLANSGAARSVELLGNSDLISVFAVDSEAHAVVPLTRIGDARDSILHRIRSIDSGGGGIFVYAGLDAAWQELKNVEAAQKHMILFADASDAEEPGDYEQLVSQITKQGAVLSVIALGTPADSDAQLLDDIASRGGGRIFFSADPNQLPALFAQETAAVARSAFIDQEASAAATGAWNQIAAGGIKWLSEIDGYNLSYLKPKASAALLSLDEYQAPLVAFWNKGVGRAAAVSFPLGGKYSEKVRSWPAGSDFFITLLRWLGGERLPSGLYLKTKIDGEMIVVDLMHDSKWIDRFAKRPPQAVISEGAADDARKLIWELVKPGHYRAVLRLSGGEMIRGAVQFGEFNMPFGPYAVTENSEWHFDDERLTELRRISQQSGGAERLDLSKVWESEGSKRFRDVRSWLYIALILVLLLETLLSRVGFRLPAYGIPLPKLPVIFKAKDRSSAKPSTSKDNFDEVQEIDAKETENEHETTGRKSRFDAAKRRGR